MASEKEYIPVGLNPKKHDIQRKEAWGIVVKSENFFLFCGLKLIKGPFFTKQEALNVEGFRGARIVHFMRNGGDRIVFFWHNKQWIKKRKNLWKD